MVWFNKKISIDLNKPMMNCGARFGIFANDAMLFQQVADFNVPIYQETQSLRAQIQGLDKTEIKIKNSPVPKDELLATHIGYLRECERQQMKIIQNAILNCKKGHNPYLHLMTFGNLHTSGGSHNYSLLPSEASIKIAINELPYDNKEALTEKEKVKSLNHLNQKRDVYKTRLAEIYPKDSKYRNAGATGADYRTEFIVVWQRLQSQCCAAINFRGEALEKYSTKKQIEMYNGLKIGDYINPDGKFRPWERN